MPSSVIVKLHYQAHSITTNSVSNMLAELNNTWFDGLLNSTIYYQYIDAVATSILKIQPASSSTLMMFDQYNTPSLSNWHDPQYGVYENSCCIQISNSSLASDLSVTYTFSKILQEIHGVRQMVLD